MIIKKYTGKTEAEATEAAKKELGSGLVIMNVREVKKKGFFAFLSPKQIEITAALEEEKPQKPQYGSITRTPDAPAENRNLFVRNSTENIEKKLDSLQTLLESQLNSRQATGEEIGTHRETVSEEKEKKDSENLPGNFIPAWYYKDKFIPEYSYAIDADDKETIEKNLKSNPVMPLDNHYLIYFYGEGLSKWVIIDNTEQMQGKGILKQVNKNPEEFPESYKLLPLSGKGSISGYMEWTFLDESGNETSYPPFDVFIVRGAQTKSENTTLITPYLYFDLTEYYQKQYPQAGVRTVVVSYAIPMTY